VPELEVVIVGGGPAGLAAGAEAARQGVQHVVLERGELAQVIVWYQKRKLVMAEPADLPLHEDHPLRFQEGSREAVLQAWMDSTKAAGTNVRTGPGNEVVGVSGAKGGFAIKLRDGSALAARHVVLALGQSNLNRFDCEGADLAHVTYQLSDPAEHEDQKIVVVGVGDAGIENALALCEKNEVSIINSGTDFPRAQARNQDLLWNAIETKKIVHYTNAQVKRFEERAIVLGTPNGEVHVEADLVICRIGARPPTEFLKRLGIAPASNDPNAVPPVSEIYESAVPGMHLVGSVIGYPLIKNCLNQGYEVVRHILGKPVEPADEPKLRSIFANAALAGSVTENLERIKRTIPLFASVTNVQLRDFVGKSTLLSVEPGRVITRRNTRADALYSIVDGRVSVTIPESEVAADTVYAGGNGPRTSTFELASGQFFGEISLLSDRLHGGTVTARDTCVILSSPRQAIVALMKKDLAVKRTLDEAFVFRRLRNLIDQAVPNVEVEQLAKTALFETFAAGATLFAEGDAANGLHIIRRGSVTISRPVRGREIVLAYVPAGNVIGEMALCAPDGKRTATVRATVFTETVRIPLEAIRPFLGCHSEVMQAVVQKLTNDRLAENAARIESGASDVVSFLMRVGAGEATNILLIDESLCIRCNNCETACADTHGGISRLDREAGPTFASVHVPTSCRHCENPKCMLDCPPDALRRHPNGEVFIMNNCIGCGNCERNCPYHVIQMAPREPPPRSNKLLRLLFGIGGGQTAHHSAGDVKKMAVKCDLCRERDDLKLPGAACERSCPTGAIVRVDPSTHINRLMSASD
jgi:thioredoxin reductase/CRP-like cAMP-binding protein/Pyruvate/2-oxoacid:ferredoxin oxidoreductase delta subunit